MEVVQPTLASSRTTVETNNAVVTKTFKTGRPIAYTATEGVYVDGTLFKAGETFVTDKPKGSTWTAVNPADRLAADAGKEIKDDVDYTAMSATELRAYLISRNVNVGDVKAKDKLLDLVRAMDVPAL